MKKVRMPQVLSKNVELYKRVLTVYLERMIDKSVSLDCFSFFFQLVSLRNINTWVEQPCPAQMTPVICPGTSGGAEQQCRGEQKLMV